MSKNIYTNEKEQRKRPKKKYTNNKERMKKNKTNNIQRVKKNERERTNINF